MANSVTFKKWHKLESARRLGKLFDIDAKVDEEMKKIRVEVRKDGKWKVID